MRAAPLLFAMLLASGLLAQHKPPMDSIPGLLGGCWFAGDGGLAGEYCFTADGALTITPPGKAREVMQHRWELTPKGEVQVSNGRKKFLYSVEHLTAEGFILVNDKHHIRLEGHREKPRKR